MKKRCVLFGVSVLALIAELLPRGVVLHFASPTPETYNIRYYSYFSLTPYGYAVVGPFIAAVLTVALAILSFIYIFKNKAGFKTAISIVSALAAVASLSPVLYGLRFLTAIGVIVTALLVLVLVLSLKERKL